MVSARSPVPDIPRALVERARAGEAQAFREIHAALRPVIIGYLSKLRSLSRDDVEEIAQKTFVAGFSRLGQLKEEGRLKPWLLTIAHNTAMTTLSKRKRERTAPELADVQALQARSDALFREHLHAAVELALADDHDQVSKEIARLYYADTRLTTQAIADQLGIPKGTVTVKLQRLRKRVHQALVRWLLEQEKGARTRPGR